MTDDNIGPVRVYGTEKTYRIAREEDLNREDKRKTITYFGNITHDEYRRLERELPIAKNRLEAFRIVINKHSQESNGTDPQNS